MPSSSRGSGIAEQDPGEPAEVVGAEVLDLDAAAVRPTLDPHPGLETQAKAVDEALDVGVGTGPRARGTTRACGARRLRQLLGRAHGEAVADDAIAQVAAPLGVPDLQQRLRMPRAEATRLDIRLYVGRELEQAQVVRDGRAIEADAIADRILGGSGLGE